MAACLFILILLIAFWIRSSHADPRLEIVAHSCETTSVQNVDKYRKLYAVILENMGYEMYRNKFAFTEAGKPPDKLYVLSQCMDDLSNFECAQCFSKIGNLLPGCLPATGGRVYLDGCFIRASNYSFYREIITEGDMKRCSDDVDTKEGFPKLLRNVLQKIVYKAPNNRGFGLAHETKNGTTVHGMAQCWRTLDKDMCSACLIDAVNSAFHCLPSEEGRALNAGCFLRYSTYKFANDPDAGSTRYAIVSFIFYIIFAVAIGLLAIAIGLCLGKLAYITKNSGRKRKGKELDLAAMDQAMQFLQFKFSTLEKATDCFDASNKLGSGGYGEVFRGTLQDGREIAIKRLYVNGKSRREEIYNEVDVISKAQHKNLVRFLGGCFTTVENFLVYEYLANKSLDTILFASEIIDESLEIEDVEETKRDIQIGLLCTQAKPALRPSMTRVLQMLRHKDMELPAPTKPPFLDECVELSSSFGFIPGKSQMFNLHRPQDCNYQCL
ncbi:hypothetical protein QUC31_018168 [Theobroma cacao]